MADRFLVHQAELDAERAIGILRGQQVRGLSVQRLLGGLRPDALSGLDLVFVPHWYCSFRVEFEGGPIRAAPDDGRRTIARALHVAEALWVMVDGLAGKTLRLADEPRLEPRDLTALAPAVAVAPRLEREEAVARATNDLRWDLRVRGRQRVAPRSLELIEARLAHVPFWVGYYRGSGGQVRAKVVHGIEHSVQDWPFTEHLLRALDRAV